MCMQKLKPQTRSYHIVTFNELISNRSRHHILIRNNWTTDNVLKKNFVRFTTKVSTLPFSEHSCFYYIFYINERGRSMTNILLSTTEF